jgi:hypothetical protein
MLQLLQCDFRSRIEMTGALWGAVVVAWAGAGLDGAGMNCGGVKGRGLPCSLPLAMVDCSESGFS